MRATVASLAFISWASLLALPGSSPSTENHFQPAPPAATASESPNPGSSVQASSEQTGSNSVQSWTLSNAASNPGLPGLGNFPLVPYSALAPATQSNAPPASSPTTGSSAGSAVSGGSGTIAGDIQSLLALTNQDRIRHGLPPFTVNSQLIVLAQERAAAMANDGYYAEDSPVYGWPFQMEQKAGIRAVWMGAENIDQASSPAMANAALMSSLPHRANILDPRETQIGIGIARLPSMPGYMVVSELFLGPSL